MMRTGAFETALVFGLGAGAAGAAADRVSGIDTGLDIEGLEDMVCLSRLLEGPLVEAEEPLKLSRSPEVGAAFFDGEIRATEARSLPSLVRFCFTGGDASTLAVSERKRDC